MIAVPRRGRWIASLALATMAWLPLSKGAERLAQMRHLHGLPLFVIQYSKDALLAALVVIGAFLVVSGATRLRIPYLVTVVIGVIVLLFLTFIDMAHGFSITGLYEIRNYVEPVAGGLAIGAILRRTSRTHYLPPVLVIVSLLVVAFGALQFALPFSSFFSEMRLTTTDQYGDLPTGLTLSITDLFRAFSTLETPNSFGLYVSLVAVATAAPSPWLERHPWIRRGARWSSLIAMAVTFSRGAVLAVLAGLAGIWAAYFNCGADRDPVKVKRTIRRVAVLVVLAGASLGFAGASDDLPQMKLIKATFSGDESSAEAHVESLRIGFERALNTPEGFGLGTIGPRAGKYGTEAKVYQVESAYLQLWLEIGIGGLIMTVLLLLSAQVATFIDSCLADSAFRRQEARAATGLLAAIVAVFIFTPAMTDLPSGTLVWSYLGLAMCDGAV